MAERRGMHAEIRVNMVKETGGMGKRWKENIFESAPKENEEG